MDNLGPQNLDHQEALNTGHLRFLRRLVTILTVTMIAGVILIIGLLVIRLQQNRAEFPQVLAIPKGVSPSAYTQGNGWAAIVTTDDRILIFDAASGKLIQEVKILSTP